MRLPRHLRLFLPLLAVIALTAAGCHFNNPRTTIHPATAYGRSLQDVYAEIFWWTLGIFIVVESLLVYAIFKFRAKGEEQGTPEQVHGHTRLEIAWTIVPAVILVFIAVPTIRTIFAVAAEAPPDALQVKVIGQQWFWNFEYPEYGIRTANELHVPVGRPIDLRLNSGDIIHSFWAPRIGGKRDLIPNRTNRITFTAEKAGHYAGQCAEFCGPSHALMRFDVYADDPDAFKAWVDQEKSPAPPPTDPEAVKGATAFLTAGCIACHRIDGTPAQARIGPDLSHVGSRKRIAGGILENTPENMARWIHNPQAVKPEAKMAKLPLTQEQLDSIVAYLQQLK